MTVSPPTKVFITSCETGPGAWRNEEGMLRAAFPRNDPQLVLVEDPQSADIVLIGNVRTENEYLRLRLNPVVLAHPEKCFVLNWGDFPARYLKGILTNLDRSIWNLGRFESGGFFTIHPDFQNPYVNDFYLARSMPAEKRDYFFSFVGRDCTPLRNQLFKLKFSRGDVFVKDNSHFNNFSHQNTGATPERFLYFDAMVRSKFALAPRGWGPGTSQRLFDAMQLGIAPVILSDKWVLPPGPDWHSFAVFVREGSIADIEKILTKHEDRYQEMGRLARAAYEQYFHGEAYIRYLVDSCHRINRRSWIPESVVQRFWPVMVLNQKFQARLEAKYARLKARFKK